MNMTLLTPFKIKFLRQQLAKTKDVPGDIIEAGVYRGGSLGIMANDVEVWGSNKSLIGYDTFEGLPELGEYDNKAAHRKGDFTSTMDEVSKNLERFQVSIGLVKGYYPHSAAHGPISFAHLDMDIFEPTLEALHFLAQYMHRDGIIVMDDYIFPNTPGIEKAVKHVVDSGLYSIEATSQWQCALRVMG